MSSVIAATRCEHLDRHERGGYEKATRAFPPPICVDPFHVVRLGQRAVDQVRRDEWNAHDRSHTRKAAGSGEVQQANKAMFRALLLKEALRLLYQLEDPALAPAHLNAWLAWASRSRLSPFVKLARHDPPPPRRHPRRDPPRHPRPRQPHPPPQLHAATPLIALVYLCYSRSLSTCPDDFTPTRAEHQTRVVSVALSFSAAGGIVVRRLRLIAVAASSSWIHSLTVPRQRARPASCRCVCDRVFHP
jgi:hypothetical protein